MNSKPSTFGRHWKKATGAIPNSRLLGTAEYTIRHKMEKLGIAKPMVWNPDFAFCAQNGYPMDLGKPRKIGIQFLYMQN